VARVRCLIRKAVVSGSSSSVINITFKISIKKALLFFLKFIYYSFSKLIENIL
jgi:hypothetical protein